MSFHTNLNTAFTRAIPGRPRIPGTASGAAHHSVAPHPPLDRCHAAPASASNLLSWKRNSRAPSVRRFRAEWYCELAWPARQLSGAPSRRRQCPGWCSPSAGLGAEIGRVLGDDSGVTVLPPSVLAEMPTRPHSLTLSPE